jgi:hypothetical protein
MGRALATSGPSTVAFFLAIDSDHKGGLKDQTPGIASLQPRIGAKNYGQNANRLAERRGYWMAKKGPNKMPTVMTVLYIITA